MINGSHNNKKIESNYLNDKIDNLKTHTDVFEEYKSLRGPGLAPTTEMGRHHDTIDDSINHRESLEIGKSLLTSRSIANIDPAKR